MAWICLGCFEIYNDFLLNKDVLFCPKVDCGCEVVEIDDLMVPIVIALNSKGYYTKFCCSGHLYNNGNPYVYFNEFCEKEDFPKFFEELPEPWYIDKTSDWVIRCNIPQNFDYNVQKQSFICDANIKLLDFAYSLEDLEE